MQHLNTTKDVMETIILFVLKLLSNFTLFNFALPSDTAYVNIFASVLLIFMYETPDTVFALLDMINVLACKGLVLSSFHFGLPDTIISTMTSG